MENERINVVIVTSGSDEIKLLELTRDQLNLLDWLDKEGYLYDYHIETGVEFESI